MVDINLEVAEAVGYADAPHDALLSLYEPGPTTAEVDALFQTLRDDLVRLSTERDVVAPAPATVILGHVSLAITRDIGTLLGFDHERGGYALSPHGYTSAGGPNDVRVTFRGDVTVPNMVGTVIHELGHAVYEQGVGREGSVSLTVFPAFLFSSFPLLASGPRM